MRSIIRGAISFVVICSMLLQQNSGMLTITSAETNLTNRYFYGVSSTGLYPTDSLLAPWGWTGVDYTSLPGGGTNISYSNFGSSYHCVGINKTVKFDGLDLLLNIDTSKAISPNDQYFYINFCNGLQQSFWTNPFSIRINRTIGQVVLYSNGSIIAVLDSRAEIMNTTQVRVQTVLIDGTHYVVVNGMIFGVSTTQLTSCNNFSNLDATYVTVSPAENNTNFSMDILYLRGGEGVDCDNIMANVPSEQFQVVNAASAIDLINAIGSVTTSSGAAITAARNKYDALGTYNGASYKPMVFNYQKLLDAQSTFNSLSTYTDKYFYGLSSSLLYPLSSDFIGYGWTGLSYTDLDGGGVNLSYDNFGDLYHCVGISKAVRFDGLELKLDVDTTKAILPEDQYFYINFSNGYQQSFMTNPFAIRISRTIGQVVLYSAGNIIGVLDNRPELINTTAVTIKVTKITDGYNVAVNGLNFGVTDSQIAACNNFSYPDATYVTLSPVSNDTDFSIDVLSLHDGKSPCSDYIMTNLVAQQPNVISAAETIHSIDTIGTVTTDSGSAIATARTKYDALTEYSGASYKNMVFNIKKLIEAESIFTDLQRVETVKQMITSLGTITINSRAAILAAETEYLELLPEHRPLVTNYPVLTNARTTFNTGFGNVKIINFNGISPSGTDTEGSISIPLDRVASFKAMDTDNYDTGYTVLSGSNIKITENEIDKSLIMKPTEPGQSIIKFYSKNNSTITYNLTINIAEPTGNAYIDNSDITLAYMNNNEVKLENSDTQGALTTPDWVKSLIIAEMRIETATPEGTLKAAVSVLDHYKEAGINGIWVTPVFDQCRTGLHRRVGYTNYGPESINPQITGTENYQVGWEMFGWFVNQAHKRNIRVLLDVTVWGVDPDSPIFLSHPEYFSGTSYWGGPMYNWGNESFKNWYIDKIMTIIRTTKIDGLRCDLEPGVTGYTVFGAIRTQANAEGYKIAIVSEAQAARNATYDFEQFGVGTYPTPHNNQSHTYYTDGTFNIVDSVKEGLGLGDQAMQTAGTGGQNRFYTFCVSDHDKGATQVNRNLITLGYQAIFAPYLPLWYMGEEMGSYINDRVLYFDIGSQLNLLDNPQNRAFFETLKKYIRIRREYKDVFEYTPLNHRDSNICKVNVTGGDTLQAYARYSGNKAIMVVPNNSETSQNYNAAIPFYGSGLDAYSSFTVTNLLTGEIVATGNQVEVENIAVQIESGSIGVYLVEGSGTAANDRHFYGVSASSLYPTASQLISWGWTGVSYVNLNGGGVNVSFRNFGNPSNTFSVNKTVKLGGLDMKLNIDTSKAVLENDQYFYVTFSNTRRRAFSSNPFSIRINRTIGQVVLYSSGNIIAVLDSREEIMNTTKINIKITRLIPDNVYNVAVNGLNFSVSDSQMASMFNLTNPDATYVTLSPVTYNSNFSIDVLSLHGGENICADDIMAGVPSEQYQVINAADAIDLINKIGTVSIESGESIAVVREKFDSLGSYNNISYKTMVYNQNTLVAAEQAYLVFQQNYPQAIETVNLINAIGSVSINSSTAIIAAENSYEALDSTQKAAVSNYQKLLYAHSYFLDKISDNYFYSINSCGLYPNESSLATFGWTGVSYTNLTNGGINVSYNNYGNLDNCVGINKIVNFNGLTLELNIDTTKATTASDQYFYINFCNVLQQSFTDNPFTIRINRTIGQVVLYSNGNIIGVLDNREEIKSTTGLTVNVTRLGSNNGYNVAVNGLNFSVSDTQIAACNNFADPDATYVTISPAGSNTNFSIDIVSLRNTNDISCDYIKASVPSEERQLFNSAAAITSIAAIGTVTINSGSIITAARAKYDLLASYNGSSYKNMVFNSGTLFSAEQTLAYINNNPVNWKLSGNYISGIGQNVSSWLLLEYMRDQNARVFDGESEAAAERIVSTGMTVKTYHDGMLQDSYTAIIYGDVTGDGLISIMDLAEIKKHVLKISFLTGDFNIAGDLSNKGSITIRDLLSVKKQILGIAQISQ